MAKDVIVLGEVAACEATVLDGREGGLMLRLRVSISFVCRAAAPS